MDWTKETYSLEYLRSNAEMYDWIASLTDSQGQGMLQFLKYAEVVPVEVEWKRGNALPRTSLDGQAIPAGYLAEVAFDYDKDGYSTAADFIDVLEFEVTGTPSNTLVSEVMSELGAN